MEGTLTAPKLETTTLDQFVAEVRSLYTLPVVAAEVLQLTASPKVDSTALKVCIERDPALTVRILRVVNSSLFGLAHPVGNLTQAITILGIKPLKLLVLGFSLPESLFANLARQELQWYWSTTLVRAVAAREISEQWFDCPGDEAFLAGLLQDIGILALLGQHREAYSRFLASVIEAEGNLEALEREALGFDHLAVSAALLEEWNMPVPLARTIRNVRQRRAHASGETSTDHLTRVMQLASLLGQLVGHKRLSVLPDLMELGAVYCDLKKSQLFELVADLQPKVHQLAQVLSLQLPDGRKYSDLLIEAHRQIAEMVGDDQTLFAHACGPDPEMDPGLREECARLKSAAQTYLQSFASPNSTPNLNTASTVPTTLFALDCSFESRLVLALGKCRSQRQALSVVMFEATPETPLSEDGKYRLSELLDKTCRTEFCDSSEIDVVSPTRRIVVLPAHDRQEAIDLTRGAIQAMETGWERQQHLGTSGRILIRAGIASVALPSKNFDAMRLMQTAARSLSAAHTFNTSGVKSLEIY